MIYSVGSNTELAQAFAEASAGDRIELRPGDYLGHHLKNRDFDTAVTIISADPSNPAIFKGAVTLSNVSNVEISDIVFGPDSTALNILDLVHVRSSKAITIRSSVFEGHIPKVGEGLAQSEDVDTRDEFRGRIEGQAFARGVRITEAESIVVENNEFLQLRKGIILDRVQQAEIAGNHLHDLRSDGVNLVDSVGVTIAENLMESFRPLHNYDNLAYADHGDFIQWWAGSGGLGIRDLTIRDNALLQGAGSWVQGIFGRGGGADTNGTPDEFSNIRIENNIINTSHTNGIFVGDARDVQIVGNTLLPAPRDMTQPLITSGIPAVHVRTSAKRVNDTEYDFTQQGALPQSVMVERNIVVGESAFSSYLIEPTLYSRLAIHETGNAILSVDRGAASFWGHRFPELQERPLLLPTDLDAPVEGFGVNPSALPERLLELLNHPDRSTVATQIGTPFDDVIQIDPAGRIVEAGGGADEILGSSGSDVLRGGTGSDQITTGEGRDRVAFHRSDLQRGDIDTVTDLDFGAGDSLVFSGGFGSGFFNDTNDPLNALTTFRSGDSAIIHDRADLIELAAHGHISVHTAGSNAIELRFDLDADMVPDWTLRLNGISGIGEREASLDASSLHLIGTSSVDTLTGGAGSDLIFGNGGSDVLTGAAGADEFVISTSTLEYGDHITLTDLDFSEGDRLLFAKLRDGEQSSVGDSLSIENLEELCCASVSEVTVGLTIGGNLAVGYDIDGTGHIDVVVDLGAPAIRTSSFAAFEPVIGTTEDDVLHGSAGKNDQIFGGVGADLLNGLSGVDRMFGGGGDDRFYVDDLGDVAVETAANGYDRVYSSVDYSLGDNIEAIGATGVANLRLTGNKIDNWITGNAGNNVLFGGDGNDRLIGFSGNDWLDGGEGADILQGGLGNDRYLVESDGDRVFEELNAGYDRVVTQVDFRLGEQVEALNASGAEDLELIGNRSHNWITGNHGNNHILGQAGNDRLVGNAGDDLLVGGTGNDVIEGGSGRDVFSFRPGDGIDVIVDFDIGTDLLLLDVIADVTMINATESTSGVLIHFGGAGDLIVLNGLTRESVEMRSIFTEQAHWALDF